MKQNKKKQIAKISVFITSIFVIFLSITYAFINMTVTGTKRQVITAGNLELELEEENAITLESAMPMYDEVGMIQNAFNFRLINKSEQDINYTLKLVKIDSDDELSDKIVRFHLTKNGRTSRSPRYLGDLNGTFNEQYSPSTRKSALKMCQESFPENNIVTEDDCVQVLQEQGAPFNSFDEVIAELIAGNAIVSNHQTLILENGQIKRNQAIEFQYRMWIDKGVEDNEEINGKSLSYRIEIEAKNVIKGAKSVAFDTIAENPGENCETYDDGTDAFLVGQCPQNYLWYSGKLWRVVSKNNTTGAVKMVTDNNMTTIAYNESGNTAFENSFVDQWLTQEFLPTLHDADKFLIINSLWDVTSSSEPNNGTVVSSNYSDIKASFLAVENESYNYQPAKPNGTTVVNRAVGLLNSYEYYTTYNYSNGLSTYATGYLNNATYWLLATPFAHLGVWHVEPDGRLNYYNPWGAYGVRPSVNLKSNIQIASGDGTESNPYRLEGDSKETINGTTLINTRYSGEYVKFNNELYRIVEVENDLTKITAVDKPSTLSSNKFHTASGVTNFGEASIKTDLETYYQGLDETTKNMIEPNAIWYLGTVSDYGISYKASICSTVDASTDTKTCEKTTTTTTANIGLPRYGEMFTSQITRGTKDYFWTLTPDSASDVWYVYERGNLSRSNPTIAKWTRPSMYLKSNVVISKDNIGDGTYEHPYEIELSE